MFHFCEETDDIEFFLDSTIARRSFIKCIAKEP